MNRLRTSPLKGWYTFDDLMVAALCGGLVVAVVAGVTALVEVMS